MNQDSWWLATGRKTGTRFPPWAGNFLFTTTSRPALRPNQPPIQLVPGVKWPGREANHSPPSSAETNNAWSYTSTPPIHLHGVVQGKHYNVTFTFYVYSQPNLFASL